MKILPITFLAVAAAQSLCFANVTNLPPAFRRTLEDASRFNEVRSTTNLPPPVVAACAGERRMADPAQKWEVSDVIWDATLPGTRLFWAAQSGEIYLVHYESGGRAHMYHFLLVQWNQRDKRVTILWHAIGKPVKDYSAFLGALERNELDDTIQYTR